MVAMLNHTFIEGKPINELVKEGKISQKDINELVTRTQKGGAEIVKYLEERLSICTHARFRRSRNG